MNIDDIFGNGWDDPRSQTIMNIAAGLMRGGIPGGIDGANSAQEAQTRRRLADAQLQSQSLGAERARLEMDGLRANQQRNRTIQEQLAALEVPKASPEPGAQGMPAPGGAPLLGGLGQPQGGPVRAPSPQGSMPGQQPPPRGGLLSPAQPGGSYQQGLMNRLVQQAQVYARNGDMATAEKLMDNAAKWMPQVHGIEVGMQDNQPVTIITFKDGTQQVSPFAPEAKMRYLDTGGSVLPIDERTNQQRGAAFPKTMTPGERAGNAVALGNLQVSRDRLALDQNAPQYVQTEGGMVALPKRPGSGPITAQAVTNADGSAITAPLKQIPTSANTAIQSNLQNLQRAQDALSLVQGKNVGTSTGDGSATGMKGYLPNSILNRVDPAGVDARAAIADLGSLTIHDRSGAAVTVAEFPRLAPFVPQPTDDRATVEKKLQRFVQVYQQEVDGMRETYGREQGYRPSPLLERAGRAAREPAPLPSNLSASNLQRGQAYRLPNGETGVWDGMRFKGQR